MLKLFRYRSSNRNAMIALHILLVLMVLCAIVIVLSAQGNQNKEVKESFLIESLTGGDIMAFNMLREDLQSMSHIIEGSVQFFPAEESVRALGPDLPDTVLNHFLSSEYISDVIMFSTQEFDTEKSRGEFVLALSEGEKIRDVRQMGMIVQSGEVDELLNKLLPMSIFLIILLNIFALSLLKSEINGKRSEIRMLSFSGVADQNIINKLRSSMGLAVIKAWLITVILIILAFYLLFYKYLREYTDFSVQDIIVALAIPLVILMISMSLYTKTRADAILKKI